MNKTKLLLSSAMVCLGTLASAQRNTDLTVTVTAPNAGLQLAVGAAPVLITFNLKNNGPNNLVAGDTLFFALSVTQDLTPVILSAALNSGQSVAMDLGLGIQNPGTLTADQNVDVCLLVLDPNTSGVTANGVPVHVTYNDPNTANNQNCVNVTIKAGATDITEQAGAQAEDLIVYPNPSTTEISVYIQTPQLNEVASISIIDITGRAVLTKDFEGIKVNHATPAKLDISHLKRGLYFLELHSGGMKKTKKIMLQY